MTDDFKIDVDAAQPATLNDGAGKQTDFATLGEAVTAWRALTSAEKIRATVKVIGGPVYSAQQIEHLHLFVAFGTGGFPFFSHKIFSLFCFCSAPR